jgi:hypothetical protein
MFEPIPHAESLCSATDESTELESFKAWLIDGPCPAKLRKGGANASVRAINPSDNMSAGAYMENVLRNLPDGTRVQIRVTQ